MKVTKNVHAELMAARREKRARRAAANSNGEALAKFNAMVAEIQDLLEGIREAADGDFDADPDTINWSWVGSAIRDAEQAEGRTRSDPRRRRVREVGGRDANET